MSESLSSVESCELISSSIPSISFVSTSNNNAVSSLMQGTEMLVDVCGSYDDLVDYVAVVLDYQHCCCTLLDMMSYET